MRGCVLQSDTYPTGVQLLCDPMGTAGYSAGMQTPTSVAVGSSCDMAPKFLQARGAVGPLVRGAGAPASCMGKRMLCLPGPVPQRAASIAARWWCGINLL